MCLKQLAVMYLARDPPSLLLPLPLGQVLETRFVLGYCKTWTMLDLHMFCSVKLPSLSPNNSNTITTTNSWRWYDVFGDSDCVTNYCNRLYHCHLFQSYFDCVTWAKLVITVQDRAAQSTTTCNNLSTEKSTNLEDVQCVIGTNVSVGADASSMLVNNWVWSNKNQ